MQVDEIPNFDTKYLAGIVVDLYGIEGEVSPLVSYEDQNALIKTPEARYVLKIANRKWSREFLQAQTDVLEYLKINAPDLSFPDVMETLEGKTISYVDGFAVRLLTYLEGDLLTNTPRTPEIYQDVGRFLGQFSKAMQNYPSESVEGSDEMWKLDNVMACKAYLSDVADEDLRNQFERLYTYYEKNILPKLPRLRKAVLHSDANEQNFLIDPREPTKISGLIDFGELQHGSQINDLAITLAYALMGENDVAMASSRIIEGYEQEFKLEDEEREILYYLMAMRLVTTITMSCHNAKLQPDNKYLLVTQQPARVLLRQLEEEKFIL
jgi:Ser/Thr protein kinase RdoA (MazF antagonist)